MTYIAPVLGVLAGLVGIADTIPYVRDTLRGLTRPYRGTWLIWSVLAIVACLSQRADGASWSLIMAGVHAILNSVIVLLSIRHGEGGLRPAEAIMIALAGAGVIGWIVADEPLIATACVVAADLLGAAMMVPKTYRDPDSETLATFAFASLGGALAAGAVGALDPSLLLYPIYYCLVNGAIAVLIHHRRRVLGSLEPLSAPRSFRQPRRWVRSAVSGSGPRPRIGSGRDDPVGAAPSVAAQRVAVEVGEQQGEADPISTAAQNLGRFTARRVRVRTDTF